MFADDLFFPVYLWHTFPEEDRHLPELLVRPKKRPDVEGNHAVPSTATTFGLIAQKQRH